MEKQNEAESISGGSFADAPAACGQRVVPDFLGVGVAVFLARRTRAAMPPATPVSGFGFAGGRGESLDVDSANWACLPRDNGCDRLAEGRATVIIPTVGIIGIFALLARSRRVRHARVPSAASAGILFARFPGCCHARKLFPISQSLAAANFAATEKFAARLGGYSARVVSVFLADG